jgi:hypothetical protein
LFSDTPKKSAPGCNFFFQLPLNGDQQFCVIIF